ncbi:4121_t:CDS:2 [Paraglomus brasilianum]|uniref:4121_t:CDS:1 n=1 Tax=Paraglomus brasilianum TaxID=144538 RepID=A0A9N9C3U5_9GLOM|nr:4121_t:CDS:2 [Paraglomus brasilianum]
MSTFKWQNKPAISARIKAGMTVNGEQGIRRLAARIISTVRIYITSDVSKSWLGHMVAAVERESIDLVDKTLAVCNEEMLSISGQPLPIISSLGGLSINVIRLFNQDMENFIKVILTVPKNAQILSLRRRKSRK